MSKATKWLHKSKHFLGILSSNYDKLLLLNRNKISLCTAKKRRFCNIAFSIDGSTGYCEAACRNDRRLGFTFKLGIKNKAADLLIFQNV